MTKWGVTCLRTASLAVLRVRPERYEIIVDGANIIEYAHAALAPEVEYL